MGGTHNLKAIMNQHAVNIAFQLMKTKASQPRTNTQLDLFAEQAFMCGVYGYVECTDVNVVEKLLRYINPVRGCSHLSYYKYNKYDRGDDPATGDDGDGGARIQKRADVLIGMYTDALRDTL